MNKHLKPHVRALDWVTDDFIARLNKFLPLERDSLYTVLEVANFLQIPLDRLRKHTLEFKSRQKAKRDCSLVVCVEGWELQPLLESYRERKPKPKKKLVALMDYAIPVLNPSETTPTDMERVMEIFDNLAGILDKIPNDEARDVSYRLARRYSRSNLKEGMGNDQEKIPSKNKMGTTMEKQTP